LVIKPIEEDHTPGTVKPFQVSLVEPVAYPLSYTGDKIIDDVSTTVTFIGAYDLYAGQGSVE